MIVDIVNTNRTYDIFYTDPPWAQSKGGKRNCRPNQGRELDYNTCDLAEIQKIHKLALTHSAEKHNRTLEVIGNIHDNPELLEVVQNE